MITMEFDDMKKIWDAQNNQPLYVMDEKALYSRIKAKMGSLLRFTNITEWGLIAINLFTCMVLLGQNHFTAGSSIFLGIEAVWMFALVVYLLVMRNRRVKASSQFDRSIHGDLNHAIALASYQMRIAQIVRWNFIPMGAIMISSGWESGKLLQVGLIILASYALAFYVTSKGYRANKRRQHELQVLKAKLESGV